MQIFKIIRNQYEPTVLSFARKWEKFEHRIITTKQQLHFLHDCKRSDILPRSIQYKPPVPSRLGFEIAKSNGKQMMKVLF